MHKTYKISKASLNKGSLKDIANVINDKIVRLPTPFSYMPW